ncbi:hypothetical protein [Legionella waltersii]|uniref:Substrate of the Dot/Icm secretion system n=1 Tax=Legionella waltersii TaxID=66969 RepID=A0A0W0ZZZ2_9GAMM|nr:hypothetical protein [Legionella waltersii]KTD74644.1 substrate of the Dot/Icm secretion system [Legionella waltersii]SNV08985.1 substrate of the Dot/Icm secretion system [Legionella waltersii]
MALSDIKIKDAVVHYTQSIITGSNYELLRQYLLERKPVQAVMESVKKDLHQLCESDKQRFKQEYTVSACETQLISDEQDAFSDQEQYDTETRLTQEYSIQLPELRKQLESLKSTYLLQEKSTQLVQTNLEMYKREESRIETRLSGIRTQKSLLTLQYPYTQTVHTHFHSHPAVVTTHPNSSYNWTWSNQLQWNNLCIEESQLLSELQQVRGNISSKKLECRFEETKLSELLEQKTTLERKIDSMQRQLNTEFPQNEKSRQRRKEERAFRASARKTEDPQLNQLSYRNREALSQKISTQNKALDRLKEKLDQEASDMSYSVFLTELELKLESQNTNHLLMNENEALKMILGIMKEYQLLATEEQRMQTQLKEENRKLQSLQRNLESNTQLAESNQQLTQNSESAASARNTSLFIGGTSAVGGVVGAIMVTNMIVDPILFFVPGGLALVAVVSLIVAFVYHIQKSSYDADIDRNNKSMISNETELLDETYKKDNANSPKPTLQQQIETTQKEIQTQSALLEEHQQAMIRLMQKGQNVSHTYQRIYPLFTPSENRGYPYTPQPSAPTDDRMPPSYEPPTYTVGDLLNYGGYLPATYQ